MIKSEELQGTARLLLDLDLNTCGFSDLFESPAIDLKLESSDVGATGLVGWFDLHCCKEHPEVVLSTSPNCPKTHWLQCWMPFPHALESSSQVQVQVQLLPQRLAGLPELCVVLSGLAAQPVCYFLDQGFVETMTSCDEPPEGKRRRVGGEAEEIQEDIEAIYFPSDVKELLDLAEKAVKEGAGDIGDAESG